MSQDFLNLLSQNTSQGFLFESQNSNLFSKQNGNIFTPQAYGQSNFNANASFKLNFESNLVNNSLTFNNDFEGNNEPHELSMKDDSIDFDEIIEESNTQKSGSLFKVQEKQANGITRNPQNNFSTEGQNKGNPKNSFLLSQDSNSVSLSQHSLSSKFSQPKLAEKSYSNNTFVNNNQNMQKEQFSKSAQNKFSPNVQPSVPNNSSQLFRTTAHEASQKDNEICNKIVRLSQEITNLEVDSKELCSKVSYSTINRSETMHLYRNKVEECKRSLFDEFENYKARMLQKADEQRDMLLQKIELITKVLEVEYDYYKKVEIKSMAIDRRINLLMGELVTVMSDLQNIDN